MANRPSRRLDRRTTATPHPEVAAERPSKDQAPTPVQYPFRIHFDDGRTKDVHAETAAEARARHKAIGAITKIKIIREKDQ